jgi:hypothetical protein
VSGAIGLVAVPPVLLGMAYGIWKENQLDKEVWQVIDDRSARQHKQAHEVPQMACLVLLDPCCLAFARSCGNGRDRFAEI